MVFQNRPHIAKKLELKWCHIPTNCVSCYRHSLIPIEFITVNKPVSNNKPSASILYMCFLCRQRPACISGLRILTVGKATVQLLDSVL